MPDTLFKASPCLHRQAQQYGWGPKELKGVQHQKQGESCYAALEAELLQLIRRSRLQLEQLQHQYDTDAACAILSNSTQGENLLSGERSIKSSASWASLLQNLHTLSVLQQRLHQQLKRQQQEQPEALAPAAATAAITAFLQEVQQLCNSKSSCNSSTRGPLPVQLPKKRVYWRQQQQQQQQQLLLELVDQVLADLELWAEEAPSGDEEAAASPVPVQAATEQQQGRQQKVFVKERRQILLLEDRRNRELLLQCSSDPTGGAATAAAATAAAAKAAAPAAAPLANSHLEEHLLDTADEMKQGALMFRERLQKDNILLQRTAATQESLQQQQERGLDAAKKLLRFSFFSSLMPLVQLAIAVAVCLAMISFIIVTPG
ncbi:hypothetical protein, conserved [Eimeria praecox]|uniref:Uncharacterized protein n=1 Tax=Eimeria praecox TaxID=51316 RepID=U6G388_9EIME|nr:hypothetical protein, conserved [Eimeria praecox]